MKEKLRSGEKVDLKEHFKFDFGTPELRKKFEFALEAADNRGGKHIQLYSHPLDYYYKKRQGGKPLINQRQKDAGDRLYKDYELGCFVRYGIASYAKERVDGFKSGDGLTSSQVGARERFRSALKFLSDDVSIWIATQVCCFDVYMNKIGLEHYPTSNQAMARLREVLDRLADHYGIPRYHYIPAAKRAKTLPSPVS